MFAIMVNEKGGEQKRLEFDKAEVTIGRVQGNDIILPKGNVSKRHSRIVLKDGKFIIVDLKSTNGTYVNGRKITSPLVVKGSDKIYIGDFILSVEELGVARLGEDPGSGGQSRPRSMTVPPPPPRPRTVTVPESNEPVPTVGLPSGAPFDEGADAELAASPSTSARSNPAIIPSRTESALPMPSVSARPLPRPAPPPQRPAARPPTLPPPNEPSYEREQAILAPAGAEAGAFLRPLVARMQVALGLDGVSAAPSSDELWSRAESEALSLIEPLALAGQLPSGSDADGLARDLVQEVLGIGPLQELLADSTVREIAVPRHDRIFVERDGKASVHPRSFTSAQAVEQALVRLLERAGRGRDFSAAQGNGLFIDAPLDRGVRLLAALAPLSAHGPSLTIRRRRHEPVRLANLVELGWLTAAMAEFLEFAIQRRRNLVVAGLSRQGRTKLLMALAAAFDDHESVVSVERAEELDLGDAWWVALIAGHDQKARTVFQEALRLEPRRLIISDVQGPEALDLVTAVAGGRDGCIASVVAQSSQHALERLQTLARLAPEAPSGEVLATAAAEALDLIIQLAPGPDGTLRVGEISDVRVGGAETIFSWDADQGDFTATGQVPSWADGAPLSLFQ